MEPIRTSNNQGIAVGNFEQHLINLCIAKRAKNQTLAFAFIVYDHSNSTIAKILEDDQYFNGLHTISGKKLDVFYVESQGGKKPFPLDNAVGFVKFIFRINVGVQTPFVLFFQIDQQNTILDSFIVKLKQKNLKKHLGNWKPSLLTLLVN